MSPIRFIEIWKHRYHKYSDIFLSGKHWVFDFLKIKILKLRNQKQQFVGVLLAEHFGDIVACEPLSRELKRKYPNSKICWIVKKTYRELLDYNPNIDVIVEEYNVLYSILMVKHNPFDILYNCHLSGLRRYNYLQKTLSNPLAVSLNILTNNYFNYGNILEVFAKVSGLPVINDAPRIYIPKSIESSIDSLQLPSKSIVIHCHSNYSPKDWQIYHWERLIHDLLTHFEYRVIEIGLKSTLNISEKGYYNLCGKLSLLETAEVIKRANYFVGIDSGPAHFANAVGTFGFLLFGKLGDFNHYMPYSGEYEAKTNAQFIVKEAHPCSELNYDEVWDVISKSLQSKVL